MGVIDKTCRYPIGKFLLEVGDIEKFEWFGETQNLYIRVSCHPYVLYSKRIYKKPRKERIQEQSEPDSELQVSR